MRPEKFILLLGFCIAFNVDAQNYPDFNNTNINSVKFLGKIPSVSGVYPKIVYPGYKVSITGKYFNVNIIKKYGIRIAYNNNNNWYPSDTITPIYLTKNQIDFIVPNDVAALQYTFEIPNTGKLSYNGDAFNQMYYMNGSILTNQYILDVHTVSNDCFATYKQNLDQCISSSTQCVCNVVSQYHQCAQMPVESCSTVDPNSSVNNNSNNNVDGKLYGGKKQGITAANCIQIKHLNGGFNVSDNLVYNICSYPIHTVDACIPDAYTPFTDYPYKGTYGFSSSGMEDISPGKTGMGMGVSRDVCVDYNNKKQVIIACKTGHPYFVNANATKFVCLLD